MISDIFPVHQRASALGFYSTGVNVGILFGFLLGGWLNEYFGWRIAFLVVGAPGILLALLVRFTVAEPIRGLSENKQVSDRPIPVTEVLALLWSRRSFRHLAVASGLTAFVAYSIISWGASYFIRSHGMSTGELGTWLALIMGLGGAIGAFGGGVIADRLGNRDKRWYVWVPAIAGMLATPFIVATYSVDSAYLALLCSVVPGVMGNVFLGSTVATVHGLVGVRMRAMSSAVFFFILNIIGLGLGPFSVGLLSDYLAPDYGQESLRYAMLMILPGVGVLAVVHFMLASRNLREDLLNAPD
jgi:MFS family permease